MYFWSWLLPLPCHFHQYFHFQILSKSTFYTSLEVNIVGMVGYYFSWIFFITSKMSSMYRHQYFSSQSMGRVTMASVSSHAIKRFAPIALTELPMTCQNLVVYLASATRVQLCTICRDFSMGVLLVYKERRLENSLSPGHHHIYKLFR